jgi:hypothetical protein
MRCRYLLALGVFAGCGGLGVTGDPTPDQPPPVALGKSSWEVSVVVSDVRAQYGVPPACQDFAFTMHLEPAADGLDVTSGTGGELMGGKLVKNGRAYMSAAPVGLPADGSCPTAAFRSGVSTTSLSLTASDADGDSVADQITGGGQGEGSSLISGDVLTPFTFTFALSGHPDVTAPQVHLPEKLDPLTRIELWASEPLDQSSHFALEGSLPVSLVPLDASTLRAVTRFHADVTVPFSGRWTVVGQGEDLTGRSVALPIEVTSTADPGVFAVDGFEGDGVAGVLSGGAKVVTGIGSLPAVSGGKSLLLEPGASVLLHLVRPAGASAVRMAARKLVPFSDGSQSADGPIVTVGVVGSAAENTNTTDVLGATVPTGDARWPYAGPPRELTATIHGSGSDLAVSLSMPVCVNFLCAPASAVLIDDLRVE